MSNKKQKFYVVPKRLNVAGEIHKAGTVLEIDPEAPPYRSGVRHRQLIPVAELEAAQAAEEKRIAERKKAPAKPPAK